MGHAGAQSTHLGTPVATRDLAVAQSLLDAILHSTEDVGTSTAAPVLARLLVLLSATTYRLDHIISYSVPMVFSLLLII